MHATCPALLLATLLSFFPDLSAIGDPKCWKLVNADCSLEQMGGANVVRMKPIAVAEKGSSIGLALVEGLAFREGTIEVELKGKGRDPSFLGVAFGAADEKHFEAVYFRPFNFTREDPPESRSHAVQYVAWPDHTWEKLRNDRPGEFESRVNPVPDPADWFKARIEVTRTRVTVWVMGSKDPCLSVERFTDRDSGQVGIIVDSKEGSFRNLSINPAGEPIPARATRDSSAKD